MQTVKKIIISENGKHKCKPRKPDMFMNFLGSKVFSRYPKYGNAFMNFSVICMVNKKSLLSFLRTHGEILIQTLWKGSFLVSGMLQRLSSHPSNTLILWRCFLVELKICSRLTFYFSMWHIPAIAINSSKCSSWVSGMQETFSWNSWSF